MDRENPTKKGYERPSILTQAADQFAIVDVGIYNET